MSQSFGSPLSNPTRVGGFPFGALTGEDYTTGINIPTLVAATAAAIGFG